MSCSTGAPIDGDGPDGRIGMEKSFSHVLRATITDACPAVAASGKRRLAAPLWNNVTGPPLHSFSSCPAARQGHHRLGTEAHA